jgi:hypothetical protein
VDTYIKQRNKLIPSAEKYAYSKTIHLDPTTEYFRNTWNHIFHWRMNLLVDVYIYKRLDSQWRDWLCIE